MDNTTQSRLQFFISRFDKIKLFHASIIIGVVFWSGSLFGLYSWTVTGERVHFTETVRLKAESLANHSQSIRRWVGRHGGVYAEVGDELKPIPLLSNVLERDVHTPSGRKLTLLNSPAILSKISPFYKSGQGDRIHLVSIQPINPSNFPDAWEKKALERLDAGASRVDKLIHLNEKSFYRLMYPMNLEPKCLNCHHNLSQVSNKVVGGLSVSVDKSPYDRLAENVIRQIRLGYFSIWIIGLLALAFFDISSRRMLQRIEKMATHDDLTKLFNRREVERHINLECHRADRYQSDLSVIMLDIDHFKRVNDTYGHLSGDKTLRVVSTIIRETIRETDIAGRYGGEEFIILIPGVSCEGTRVLAERLRNNIKATAIQVDSHKRLSVSASIGISGISPDIKSPEQLVKSADEALYRAKATGRDRTCIAEQINKSIPIP